MTRRITVLCALILILSVPVFAGTPWSYSVGLSGLEYNWLAPTEDILVQEQILGLDFRGAVILPTSGFYYGSFLNFSRPVMTIVTDEEAEDTSIGPASHDFYTSFGIPFGYRWRLGSGRYGIYMGAGPALQIIADLDSYAWISGGAALEFGLESLKAKGVGFSFGTRALVPIGAFVLTGTDVYQAPMPFSVLFYIGISWTRDRA